MHNANITLTNLIQYQGSAISMVVGAKKDFDYFDLVVLAELTWVLVGSY
jgi:hypothetical protein